MRKERTRIQTQYHRFGNIIIALGMLPIAKIMIGLWADSLVLGIGLYELEYFFEGWLPQLLVDLVLVIFLLIMVINNKNIRDQTDNVEFRLYYRMITLYFYLSLVVNAFFYIGFLFASRSSLWTIILMIYDAIFLITSTFELFVWIRLSKYVTTLRYPFNTSIKYSSIILNIGVGFFIGLRVLDLSSFLIKSSDVLNYLSLIYLLASCIGAVIYNVGCVTTGNSIKQAWLNSSSAVST